MYRRCITAEADRRQAAVEQCLLNLMGELPYGKISVQTVCDRMDISRTAFYRYFQNKDACLQSLLDRTLYESALFAEEQEDRRGVDSIFQFLRFWKRHGSLLDVLLQNDLMDRLVLQMVRYVKTEEPGVLELLSTAHMDCDEEVLIFTLTGLLALIIYWHQSGYRLSEEQMEAKIRRLMTMPLVQV